MVCGFRKTPTYPSIQRLIEIYIFLFKSPLGHPWDLRAPASSQMPLMRGTPQNGPDATHERYPPKWFSAITCAIWLRLIFRGRGSAWFFGAHLLFFHARGRIFEPGIGFWIPTSTCWTGDLFLVPKNIFLQRNDFVVRILANPSCPNEF